MNTVVTQAPSYWNPFRFFKFIPSNARKEPANTASSDEESRIRRSFVLEMMQAHPEAFQHELDVQTMMQFYSLRF